MCVSVHCAIDWLKVSAHSSGPAATPRRPLRKRCGNIRARWGVCVCVCLREHKRCVTNTITADRHPSVCLCVIQLAALTSRKSHFPPDDGFAPPLLSTDRRTARQQSPSSSSSSLPVVPSTPWTLNGAIIATVCSTTAPIIRLLCVGSGGRTTLNTTP